VALTAQHVRGWTRLSDYPVGSIVHVCENQKGTYGYISSGIVCAHVTAEQTRFEDCLVIRVDCGVEPIMVMVSEQFDIIGKTREEVISSIDKILEATAERNKVWKNRMKDFKL